MVNYHDPAEIVRDFFMLVKLWHTVDGVYIWEFFATLDYEWSIIRGRHPYQWTIWAYSYTRAATLMAVIMNLAEFSITSPINCQVFVTMELVFFYSAFVTALLLIALRTIAIWNRNKIVLIIAMGVWWTNVSFLIEGLVRLRASWEPLPATCVVLNVESSKPALIATLATGIILLFTTLIGLFRMHFQGAERVGLVGLLRTQGLVWFFLATIAEVPSAVLMCLDLNYPYSLMFQTPSLIMMSIAATRMYRALSNYGSSALSQLGDSARTASKSRQIPVAPIPLYRMDMAGHTNTEQYSASSAGHYGSYNNTDEQLYDKPQGLALGDCESRVDK